MKIVTVVVGDLATNCYLISDEEGHALCVDPGAEASRILQTARRNGMRIEGILLTHAHFDHIGAVEALREATGAPLWVPQADASMLGNPLQNLSDPSFHPPFATKSVVVRPAERELSEGDTLQLGSLHATVWHTAGHTKGSSCYVFESENTVLTGDTLFKDAYGRTDLFGGSVHDLAASVSRLKKKLNGYTAYAGHGAAFFV